MKMASGGPKFKYCHPAEVRGGEPPDRQIENIGMWINSVTPCHFVVATRPEKWHLIL